MFKLYQKVTSKAKELVGSITEKKISALMYGRKKIISEEDIPKGEWYMWEKITNIEEVGDVDMIDIEVSGNHLFYANDILTHNSNSDVGLEDTSESFGLPATVDFMFALISTEELEAVNQIMVKQLKNRYSDPGYYRRFVVGIDRSKMRLYDVEDDAQESIIDVEEEELEYKMKSGFNKDKFKKAFG